LGINRRQFLRRSAAAVTSISLSRLGATDAAAIITKGPARKVLILGAGMAGLVVGYELTQLGHDVTILEARARPGGRVHTLREPFSDGLFAEEGAARIPENHDLTLKYVNLFQLPLEPFYPSLLKVVRFDGGVGRREEPIDGFTDAMTRNYGGELGGQPSRWQKIKGGTDLLPAAFATRLSKKIYYSSPVLRINQDAKQCQVTFLQEGKQQTLTADRLVCTIPFSVLKGMDTPGFSERKRNVIRQTAYDSVARVFLQTRERVWEKSGFNGFAFTSRAVEIWQPTWNLPGTRGILMTYSRPGEAEKVTSLSEAERISTTLTQLDSIFGGLRPSFERGASKCWTEDEWAKGAWGFAGFGAGPQPDRLIHFAGEHLSPWSSWMQGALSSGLKVVKEIDEV
jgi:monoamine oxidase